MTGFEKYLETKIALFIASPAVRQHTHLILNHLGFSNVNLCEVPGNYFEAINQVVPIIRGEDELILIHLPLRADHQGQDKIAPIELIMDEVYTDIKSQLGAVTSDPLKLLSKTVPIMEVGQIMREKLLEVLMKYRVPAAFFMSILQSTMHLPAGQKKAVLRENLELHLQELITYLGQYFGEKEHLVARLDEKILEQELSKRKRQYDELMAEAEEHKKNRSFEAAINCLRQAIEVFPDDIEAYLESGRIFIRKSEYARALARFVQAEELFQDAPAPNSEIGNMRLIQVEEKILEGEDPGSPEIKKLLDDAVKNFNQATNKAIKVSDNQTGDAVLAGKEIVSTVGQTILKWDLGSLLGVRHPAIKELVGVAEKSLEALDGIEKEDLTARQLIAIGLRTLDQGNIEGAVNYYFRALKDTDYFSQACTETNFFGMKLRSMGHFDEAIKVYEHLLSYNPHNLGSIFWNMAVVYSHLEDPYRCAGYMARALYVDPQMAKETEFYHSLTPALTKTLIPLIKTVKHVKTKAEKINIPPGITRLYQTQNKLVELIEAGEKIEALKLFLALYKKTPKFTTSAEFYMESVILQFAQDMLDFLKKKKNPKLQEQINLIETWLAGFGEHPPPPQLVRYMGFTQSAIDALEDGGDQPMAVYYLSQALLSVPISNFNRPDFYVRESLSELNHEIWEKMKFIDLARFPKAVPETKKASTDLF